MFIAQIGCAALGVLALSLFGPGWLARGAALSACIAFMTITGASHPPGKTPMRKTQSGCIVFHLCFPELLF
jgi:CBS-domain-containing membrane protein